MSRLAQTSTDEQIAATYPGPLEKVHFVSINNIDEYMKIMGENEPVVFTDFPLAKGIVKKWNLEYLKQHLPPSYLFDVKASKTGPEFLYCNERHPETTHIYEFQNKISDYKMSVHDFIAKFKQMTEQIEKGQGNEYMYIQDTMTARVGTELFKDYLECRIDLTEPMAKKGNWGEFGANVLFVGMKGCITPFHFDEQHNLFCQINYKKRVWLVHPRHWSAMRPFPVGHPADRQSQLVDSDPQSFANIPGYDIVLQPGDVLYMPRMWWHRIENFEHETTSLSFWWKEKQLDMSLFKKPVTNLYLKINIRRNLERLIIQTHSAKAAATFWARLDTTGSFVKFLEGANPTMTTILKFAVDMASHVFETPDCESFLLETAKSRFAHLKIKD